MKLQILAQGAEAKIILDKDKIIKERIPKSYRLKELDDKIRKHRTKKEKKLLEKACKLISSPNPLPLENFYQIKMPFIKGEKLSDALDRLSLKKQEKVMKEIGKSIGKLHEADIIHGDLTTSNMILTENLTVFFIDFGLGFISHKIEDKAVDLHLLKQALEARHFQNWEKLFGAVIEGCKIFKESKKVLERIKAIEKRGRYKY